MPYKQISKISYKWNSDDTNTTESRVRVQIISDIYKTIQSRLDGYRQSAGAVFLAVFASTLTFDSTLIKGISELSHHSISIEISLLIALIPCVAGFIIINSISRHFTEMTSIIYKIDSANKVWAKGTWLENEALYPSKFEEVHEIGRSEEGRSLYGWTDPAISNYQKLIFSLGGFHGFFLFWVIFFSIK